MEGGSVRARVRIVTEMGSGYMPSETEGIPSRIDSNEDKETLKLRFLFTFSFLS